MTSEGKKCASIMRRAIDDLESLRNEFEILLKQDESDMEFIMYSHRAFYSLKCNLDYYANEITGLKIAVMDS